MTINKAPWAVDGALINAALARTSDFAASSGDEGIVQSGDFKVQQLTVAGSGLRVAAGAAVILNRYQSVPNQLYTVANPGLHTVPAASMPAANASQQNYIVCIVVGDPEFTAASHPFMPSVPIPAEQRADYEYVRIMVLLESTFNARTWPALALARIVVPPNTTAITDAMITNLRVLAKPRNKLEINQVAGPSADNTLNGGGGVAGTYERFPNVAVLSVAIPPWAVKAKIIGFVEGVKITKAGSASLRAYIEGTSTATNITDINEPAPAGTDRGSYNFAGVVDVKSVAGTTKTFSVQATPINDASKGAFVADGKTSAAIQVYFEEQPT